MHNLRFRPFKAKNTEPEQKLSVPYKRKCIEMSLKMSYITPWTTRARVLLSWGTLNVFRVTRPTQTFLSLFARLDIFYSYEPINIIIFSLHWMIHDDICTSFHGPSLSCRSQCVSMDSFVNFLLTFPSSSSSSSNLFLF